jgi:2-polyprenyl-3-methyl-5-hydroxy-6-metoxy-1,4-benzoquinol methylase
MNYSYPVPEDSSSERRYIRNQALDRYERRSELRALELARCYIMINSPFAGKVESLLDLGCGNGRLFAWATTVSERVTGVEPDAARAATATAVAVGFNGKIDIHVASAEEFAMATYDVVLCSHVLEHVTPNVVRRILANLFNLIRPSGILILTTMVARDDTRDEWRVIRPTARGAKPVETNSNRRTFKRYAIRPVPGVLPCHSFALPVLRNTIESCGLEILATHHYRLNLSRPGGERYLDVEPSLIDAVADVLVELRRVYARDIFVVARRPLV